MKKGVNQINTVLIALISLILLVFGIIGMATGEIPTAGTDVGGTFSTILTIIGGFGFLVAYHLWNNKKWAKIVSVIIGIGFLLEVYIESSLGWNLKLIVIGLVSLFIVISLAIDLVKKH